ncbi:MAG: hypothetical protein LBD55_03875 [Treponema sp.]|nr:hypothetical protein [Treponema sp.]
MLFLRSFQRNSNGSVTGYSRALPSARATPSAPVIYSPGSASIDAASTGIDESSIAAS